MKGLFLHFINRVLYPTVPLKSVEEIDRFIDSESDFEEGSRFYRSRYEPMGDYYNRMSKHVRVIGFFPDKKEFSNEFKLFQNAA